MDTDIPVLKNAEKKEDIEPPPKEENRPQHGCVQNFVSRFSKYDTLSSFLFVAVFPAIKPYSEEPLSRNALCLRK